MTILVKFLIVKNHHLKDDNDNNTNHAVCSLTDSIFGFDNN
jgi:hypothetical protein